MNEPRAIVILYNGEELPEYLINRMIEPIVHNGIADVEDITMKVFDSESLANLGLCDTISKEIKKDNETHSDYYAFEQAIIYVGNRFERALNKDDLSSFAIELSMQLGLCASVFEDKMLIDANNPLVNAVKIIATTTVTRKLNDFANKHKVTKAARNIIKTIWKPYQNQ